MKFWFIQQKVNLISNVDAIPVLLVARRLHLKVNSKASYNNLCSFSIPLTSVVAFCFQINVRIKPTSKNSASRSLASF